MTGILVNNTFQLLCVALLFTGCAAKKAVVGTTESTGIWGAKARSAVLAGILEHKVYYQTFNGRAKAHVAMDGEEYDATLHVRMERDRAIWISVTASLGIEVARMLITPDSVQLINRLQKDVVRQPFSYVSRFTGTAVPFVNLQELLAGQALSLALTRDAGLTKNVTGYMLTGKEQELEWSMQTDTVYRMRTVSISHANGTKSLEASYDNRDLFNGQSFPRLLKLMIRTGELDLRTTMEYDRVICDEKVEMPFRIPDSYEEL